MPDYAPHGVWSSFHTSNDDDGDDLNAEGWWAQQLMPFFEHHAPQSVLDLGCGTGGDALVLARQRHRVIGLDYSAVAVARAKVKASPMRLNANFLVADLGCPLPLNSAVFDRAMGNVSLHMFSDAITRAIVEEVWRVVKTGGLFMFHVNSTEHIQYRQFRRVEEIELDFYLEEQGGTMRFFSESYCRDILSDWTILHLQHLKLHLKLFANRPPVTKCVWQAVACKNG